jgi:chromosome partitioning protein
LTGSLNLAIRKIVVLNPKGGSGKTTIATNLAACYASRGIKSGLIDIDRQGSSMRWAGKRKDSVLPVIHAVTSFDTPKNVTRSFAMRMPPDVVRIITDTPAAMARHELINATRLADKIIVPVLPSDIDIHAATRCIGDLLVAGRIPRSENRIAVVANRVKRNTRMYQALMRFLDSLHIPVVAVLRDSQNYIRSSESGVGIHEMRPPSLVRADIEQWHSLIDWIEHGTVPRAGAIWADPDADDMDADAGAAGSADGDAAGGRVGDSGVQGDSARVPSASDGTPGTGIRDGTDGVANWG